MALLVYSKDLNDGEFRQYMENGAYKPISFCPICKTHNTRIGAHLFLKHDWSKKQVREFYRLRIVFVHTLATRSEKIIADEWIKGEMEDY